MASQNDDDRPPIDPAESLRLIQRERAQTERVLTPDPRLLLWPWGIAWTVGFLCFFLSFGPDGRVFVSMPAWVPLTVLLTLLAAAGVTTSIASARAGRWVSGPSNRQGGMYGLTWFVAFTGAFTVLARVGGNLPADKETLLWTGVMVALTGALHMAGGVIFTDRSLFALGVWISVINVAGVLSGPGWHSLVVAVGGGGGMLAAGTYQWLRLRP